MSRSRLAATAPDDKDYFDKYHNLRSQHESLKGEFNNLQDEFVRFKTQSRKTQAQVASMTGGKVPPESKLTKDDETAITRLYQENSKLKASNKNLKEKCKTLTDVVDKKTREVSMLRTKLKNLPSNTGTSSKFPAVSMSQEIDIMPTHASKRTGVSYAPSTSMKENDNSLNTALDHQGLVEVARKYKSR